MNAGKWVNDVQDNGEGYNKVLIQLSAKLQGEVELCYFEVLWYYKYMNVQIFKNIQNSYLNGMNESTKIWNMKHERNKKKRREMQKEKEIKCK